MPTEKEQKLKIIEDAISSIEKTYGKGSIMKLGDGVINNIESIPTGAISLDYALGIGGIPRGRVIEVYGPESSGKTTLCLHIIAEAQKMGGLAAFIDAEHALDVNYAKKLGVDSANLLISQPDFGEQALEIADTLVRSNALDVIVIDSVAALVPRSEIEGEMGDATMAVQARLMSQALRKLTAAISKSKTSVIFINQLRSKIGVMFGNPETTTGGNALKFYASLRIDIRRIAAIKDGENVIGNRTKVKIVKSKVAPPFKQIEFDILYNEGISKTGDLIDLGVSQGIIKKSGAWFTYDEERFQGREGFRQKLAEMAELGAKLEKEIREKLGMNKNGDVKKEEPEEKQKPVSKKSK
ncbi:MAG: recombinase RecA [Ignavibacteria bacterium]|nr:recombinase RecA [Ignavibacteria bacterium]MBT8382520.1 recombinase RecA [Ignavibacteria bacterium]MBT8390838.1 recombinase RecA [Ignavibacteria bacterium]NNJ54208.1 recombinase RecA [Ignavibacteriaceae bacterium]NNL21220.1 recombinase RecA [Ignavibacteriaceae bacterium]